MDKETQEAVLMMLSLTVAVIALIWMIHMLMVLPGLP